MPTSQLTRDEALALIDRIDKKYRPVWEGRTPEEQASLALYFLPHRSRKPILGPTRPRIVKWYCPFAAQCDFRSGHRYCVNVYTGCSHSCVYCYAASYAPETISSKPRFEQSLEKDMGELDRFDVPPAPIHMSNSTDPFQPIENEARHTRFALEQILEHRRRFTTVTILTKNPLRAAGKDYVELFQELGRMPRSHPCRDQFRGNGWPGLVVEVSMAFWREEASAQYDPCAPSVADRMRGLRTLRDAGIPLVLRIDPLFPHLTPDSECDLSYQDLDLTVPQTLGDLDQLIAFARELGVRHVVYSTAKITQPRGRKLSATMRAMREIYNGCVSPGKCVFRGGSWRLPNDIAKRMVVQPFLDICDRHGVVAKYCKQNLAETP